jgi:hypothetical protein
MTRTTMRMPSRLAAVAIALALLLTIGLAQAPARAATTGTSVSAASTTVTPKTLARQLMRGTGYGWTSTSQWTCLNALWSRESGWRITAGRPTGSYGIPQANPGRKMGTGWRTSARTQITWGLRYIKGRYSTPCRADTHQRRTGWY